MKCFRKKTFKIALLCIAVLFFMVFIVKTFIGAEKEMDALLPYPANLNQVRDGEYIGKAATSFVEAEVLVIVKNHEILRVDILEHQNGLGKKAEGMVKAMVDKNTMDVDEVSGATMSGKVIKCAVGEALRKGEGQ